MKHNNESIDRLDGDFYELMDANTIYMPHVSCVGAAYRDMHGACYEIIIGGAVKLVHLLTDEYIALEAKYNSSDSEEYFKAEKDIYTMAEKHKQQFIEVWKHWKSK